MNWHAIVGRIAICNNKKMSCYAAKLSHMFSEGNVTWSKCRSRLLKKKKFVSDICLVRSGGWMKRMMQIDVVTALRFTRGIKDTIERLHKPFWKRWLIIISPQKNTSAMVPGRETVAPIALSPFNLTWDINWKHDGKASISFCVADSLKIIGEIYNCKRKAANKHYWSSKSNTRIQGLRWGRATHTLHSQKR